MFWVIHIALLGNRRIRLNPQPELLITPRQISGKLRLFAHRHYADNTQKFLTETMGFLMDGIKAQTVGEQL